MMLKRTKEKRADSQCTFNLGGKDVCYNIYINIAVFKNDIFDRKTLIAIVNKNG